MQLTPQFARLSPRSRAILRKVLRGSNGIETRHLALDSLHEVFETGPDILQARFTRHAPVLAAQAAERALRDAGLAVGDVDALLVSTCTGYLCPGLTSYVSERLGLRPDALLLDLVGQGCGAALPNLRTGEALLASGRCRRVVSICVEVCSAAFYLDDDPGVLISACLFGDGAGAAVLSPEPKSGGRTVKWTSSHSVISAKDRDLLRFEHSNGMLRNVLSPQVPALAARYSAEVLDTAGKNSVTDETQAAFVALGWRVEVVTADVFDWLKKDEPADAMICNLFLHHFSEKELEEMLRLASARTRLLAACEPRREALPLLFSRLVWFIGCNAADAGMTQCGWKRGGPDGPGQLLGTLAEAIAVAAARTSRRVVQPRFFSATNRRNLTMSPNKNITIIGGGLAGLTLGIGLRQRSVPVTILRPDIIRGNRVCGEFISGKGQSTLARLGLLEPLLEAGAIPARTAVFFSSHRASPVRELAEPALSVSRHVLDALLAAQFRGLGGELRENEALARLDFAEGFMIARDRAGGPESVADGWRWFWPQKRMYA